MQSEMAKDTMTEPRHAEKSPLKLLRESKASIEGIVARMLSIKKEGNPKSENQERLTQIFLNFINLRQVLTLKCWGYFPFSQNLKDSGLCLLSRANRAILMEEEKVKAETELAKSPVDLTTLQLNNLMYEKSHYVKATKACRDFNSGYLSIELLSEQDFLRDAPETLSNDSSHNLLLKRLNFAPHQRKDLCKLQARLEQHKKCLLETFAEWKKFLSSLLVHLKSLKKAWLPMQNQLSLQNTKNWKHHNLAELLPPPLYVIYSQFMAQKEAFKENIDLEVSGSPNDSQTYAQQQAEKNLGMFKISESPRLEDDGSDDDGKRQRKRHKKEASEVAGLYQVSSSHSCPSRLRIFIVL